VQRPLGLVTICLVALLLLAPAMPATAHPAVVGPAVGEPGDPAGGGPGSPQADDDPGSSREFSPVVSTVPVSGSVDAVSPPSAPFESTGVLCLVALAVIAMIARRRRPLGVLLTTVLAILAFEAGLHSVHHLGERHALAPCTIASASGHLVATEMDALAFDPPTSPAFERLHRLSWMAPVPRAIDAHESRGPPAPVTV
jgi:hypothetical protein